MGVPLGSGFWGFQAAFWDWGRLGDGCDFNNLCGACWRDFVYARQPENNRRLKISLSRFQAAFDRVRSKAAHPTVGFRLPWGWAA
ncbi:hypothetical protein [Kingella oralis]|uniref:hypothetical protein n=1 Tax=Kingella oralis TaxID=505 RepID=UPI0034E379E3